ncbi:Similar to hypothetical protein [Arthrospira platensis NIES-39]; acc. no. BAI90441 [Pyronema omphalodes CBS 100304]|uniref:Uncharacterized protein n=1 Tax=Pyronema omphalodes (strain CBS 100304) TaxID=1076935 RepID=U4LJQ0_PYROM|nr:Similar to hypothetical protein [Arthrospira platensis NIES-39]; acc. no. BAI90441 [Pyronema omphalodes CBS 100304]
MQGLGTTPKRRCFFWPRGSLNSERGFLFWTGEKRGFLFWTGKKRGFLFWTGKKRGFLFWTGEKHGCLLWTGDKPAYLFWNRRGAKPPERRGRCRLSTKGRSPILSDMSQR